MPQLAGGKEYRVPCERLDGAQRNEPDPAVHVRAQRSQAALHRVEQHLFDQTQCGAGFGAAYDAARDAAGLHRGSLLHAAPVRDHLPLPHSVAGFRRLGDRSIAAGDEPVMTDS